MVAGLLEPRMSPLLVGIHRTEIKEDSADIEEGLNALAEEEGTVSWEEYQQNRAARRRQGALSG